MSIRKKRHNAKSTSSSQSRDRKKKRKDDNRTQNEIKREDLSLKNVKEDCD